MGMVVRHLHIDTMVYLHGASFIYIAYFYDENTVENNKDMPLCEACWLCTQKSQQNKCKSCQVLVLMHCFGVLKVKKCIC